MFSNGIFYCELTRLLLYVTKMGIRIMASYFLEIYTKHKSHIKFTELFRKNVVPRIIKNEIVSSVHLYTPCQNQELAPSDQNPPRLTLELNCKTVTMIEMILRLISDKEWFVMPEGYSASHQVFDKIKYPCFGENNPEKRKAKISYVVRYSQPILDEKKFVKFYLTHHPQVLAHMPAIRNILCYVPLNWDDPLDLPNSNYIVGNEVVFDSLKDLKMALKSNARKRAREDMMANPVRPGPVTHFTLTREDFN